MDMGVPPGEGLPGPLASFPHSPIVQTGNSITDAFACPGLRRQHWSACLSPSQGLCRTPDAHPPPLCRAGAGGRWALDTTPGMIQAY